MKKEMNKILVIIGSAIVVASLILTGLTISRPINVKVELPTTQVEQLGALSGPDVIFPMRFHKTISWNQPVLATTTIGTATTLKASDMNSYGMIDLMSNKAAFTYTLSATSTMIGFLPNVGDTREWIFHNATSTSGITLTIAKGAGMDLVAVDANADVLAAGDWGVLVCSQIYYRSADNENIRCEIRKLINAD